MLFYKLHFKLFRNSEKHSNLEAHLNFSLHDSLSNGEDRFAFFATCGLLLIFQATYLYLLFLILLLKYVCFWEKEVP